MGVAWSVIQRICCISYYTLLELYYASIITDHIVDTPRAMLQS